MVKNLKIFPAVVLASIAGGFALSHFMNAQQVILPAPTPFPLTPVIEEQKENKEIQTIPCLYFDSPVAAFKIEKTDEEIVAGYQDEQEIYGSKYVILEEKTTQCVIDSRKVIGVEFIDGEGKKEVKPCSAYTDVEDNSLVVFPNAVVTQTVVETVKTEYETENGKSIIEVPVYQDTLSFTTDETVTSILVDFEITDEGMKPVESIHTYIPAR